jgi:hypothetical protein
MGLEGRGTLMPSSSIPGLISLPSSIQASAEVSPGSYPTRPSLYGGGKIENRTALDMALRSVQM